MEAWLDQLMQDWLGQIGQAPEWLKVLLLAASTLISEDLTTISAGVLASQGSISLYTAILGCFLGIFIGDGALYVVGLVAGKRALGMPIIRNILTEEKVAHATQWFEKNGIWVVIISRFVPGTRLPTYFAAGLLGTRARFFLPAAAIAVGIWTPLVVWVAYTFGEQVESWLSTESMWGWVGLALLVGVLFLLMRFLMSLTDWKKRRHVRSRLWRIYRWEFWPIAVLYGPVIVYHIWQMFRRFTWSFMPLASNPAIAYSGFVGESKFEIYDQWSDQDPWLAKTLYLDQDLSVDARVEQLTAWMNDQDLAFPVILKPDVGQRGMGFAKAKDREAAKNYIQHAKGPIIAQELVAGPYEFGVYYRRYPDEPQGRILGLTGKEFPTVVGDGKHTLEELVLKLPVALGRYHIYLEQFGDRLKEPLAKGEVVSLARSGNHCFGAIFNDSSHLITEAMQERFDDISRSLPGFYIGRYDVLTSDLEAFRQGRDFKIIELNGAAGEPGHIYDARHGLLYAYRELFQQHRDLWRIGAQNIRDGATRQSPLALWRALREFQRKSYEL